MRKGKLNVRKSVQLIISLLLVVALSFPAVSVRAENSLNVQKHTADEIREFVEKTGAFASDSVSYSKTPVLNAPYDAGSLSDATQQSAVSMLNQMRFIAGIDANVTLDESYIECVQAGALVNAVNNQLSHTPAKPEDMSDELYQLGYAGTSSSNIGWNYRTLNSAILSGWMYDGDSSNISRMGHRRWLLNPKMGKTGFGMVGAYSAVYAFDGSNPSDYTNVAWPAQTMPIEYFGASYPWTLSTGISENEANVSVTLTRKSDHKVWSFYSGTTDGAFYVNNDGYGQKGCIIFRPDQIDSYAANDVFEVEIRGLSQGTLQYEVTFFSLDNGNSTETQKPDNTQTPIKSAAPMQSNVPIQTAAPIQSSQPNHSAAPAQTSAPSTETPVLETLYGDANNDGTVDLNDAHIILTAALGIDSSNLLNPTASDLDGSGDVDLSDARGTLLIALGIATYEEIKNGLPTEEPEPEPQPTPTPTQPQTFEEQVLQIVNQERAKAGLEALTMDNALQGAAYTRAVEISSVFSHTRPDGRDCFSILQEQNIAYWAAGENIAWGQRSPEEVMNSWMNSPGHRANILTADFNKIGIGFYRDASGNCNWVQLFIKSQ